MIVDLRRKRRWPVVVGLILFVWLCYSWIHSASPVFSSSVGGDVELSPGVLAVISLFDTPAEDTLVYKVGEMYGGDGFRRNYVVHDNGSISSVDSDELGKYLLRSSRPHFWFLPNIDGAFYMMDGEIGSVRPLFIGDSGVSVPYATPGFDGIVNPLAADAVFGQRVFCGSECRKELVGVYGVGFSEDVVFEQQFLARDGRVEDLFLFSPDDFDLVRKFASEIAGISNPVSISRSVDGVDIDEMFAAKDIEGVSEMVGEVEVISFGEDRPVFLARDDMRIVLGFDRKLLVDTIVDLSTLLLTSDVCGTSSSRFFTLNYWPELGKNMDSSYVWSLGEHKLSICEM